MRADSSKMILARGLLWLSPKPYWFALAPNRSAGGAYDARSGIDLSLRPELVSVREVGLTVSPVGLRKLSPATAGLFFRRYLPLPQGPYRSPH